MKITIVLVLSALILLVLSVIATALINNIIVAPFIVMAFMLGVLIGIIMED